MAKNKKKSTIQAADEWRLYLRVSDEDKQTPERSFAMQRKEIHDQLLSTSSTPIGREYCDLLTGTTYNRQEFQQMLEDAHAGKFSHLALYRPDRFGRDVAEGLPVAKQLIDLGVKIRVASSPNLEPENPEGYLMFLIQMGLAQHEVDVLRIRTNGGMRAKLLSGGWAHKAPEGYVNKERAVSSNKYERWVEPHPEKIKVIRKAWDLLLTDKYTLVEICKELTRQGYIRSTGRPWVWIDPESGIDKYADGVLFKIFHNPFYSGWVTSEKFGIKVGQVRGDWEPVVTTEEFERGLEILRKHDGEKSRQRRYLYLLSGLVWVEHEGRLFRLSGSSPKGRSHFYPYYMTAMKINCKSPHFPCELIDGQMDDWIAGLGFSQPEIPIIQSVYRAQISQIANKGTENKLETAQMKIKKLKTEEDRLARMYISNDISEEAYRRLRKEWQVSLAEAEKDLADLSRDTIIRIDDLDTAIALLSIITELYTRLDVEHRRLLLHILFKKIVVDANGKILRHELNPPFRYFEALRQGFFLANNGSEQVSLGALFI